MITLRHLLIFMWLILTNIFNIHHLKAQLTHVITYNIKYDDKNDNVNNWNDRKAYMVKQLRHYDVSIFGLQEALFHQCAYLDSSLTNFTFVGAGRDDGKQKGEFSPIFYDSTQYEALQSGTFWLSETPEKPGKSWDAAFPRVCTYVLLKDKNLQTRFWVFNTHFDHIGVQARINSAKLITDQLKIFNRENLPVILMGDFNIEPQDAPIQTITEYLTDGLTISKKPLFGPFGTFNGFNQDIVDKRIDYFFTHKIKVFSYTHLDDKLPNGKHISDHYPVFMSFEIQY
ncbi:MAG TPA: endonuclease/exonuclease/phosphatase family protein [Saprospiraceae bacterium]|nr:endonuclease/exonuclease/phosphatase family protein [Saprospiraceae bacterium]